MRFSDLKIGTRILSGFAVLSTITVLIALFASIRFHQMSDVLEDTVEQHIAKISLTKRLQDNLNVVARAVRNILLTDDPARQAEERKRIEAAATENTQLLEQLASTRNEPREQEAMELAKAARAAYLPVLTKGVELAMSGQKGPALELMFGDLRKHQNDYMAKLQKYVELEVNMAKEQAVREQKSSQSAANWMIGVAVLSGIAGVLLGMYIARSVVEPIHEAEAIADAVAAGDLTREIRPHSKDEAGHLLAALRDMNANLVSMVGKVRAASDSIVTGASEVAAGGVDLSQRTEAQAANLEETAASLEQITSNVAQSSETARQANQLAHQASDAAVLGGEVVGHVVKTMNHITQSSHKMSEIIGVIDGIAFQTNILALNAAVEAARAGEAGRGFAVVAGEVRSLAQRSAEAAREIKQLIQTSISNVEEGSKLVEDAGQSMEDIVARVRNVSDLIGELSAAAVEQSGGIQQINTAVAQMDEMTQQNAALVEESSAAASSLQAQANGLLDAVSVFQLRSSGSAAVNPLNHKPRAEPLLLSRS